MTSPSNEEFDPVFIHAWRESRLLVIVFGIFTVWCIPVCWFMGYRTDAVENVATVWGIPSWVFWGILLPWIAADIFTLWFCFFFMVNDDLGEEANDAAGKPM